MQPPQQLTTWIITTDKDQEETIVALGFQPIADGSIIFGDQFGPSAAINARHWKKIRRSSIHPVPQGDS